MAGVFDGHLAPQAQAFRERMSGRKGVRVIAIHQQMGEAPVLMTALREARGKNVVRISLPLQVEAEAVLAVVARLETGADCVLVERVEAGGRPEGGWQRRAHNRLLSRLARTSIRDIGCVTCGLSAEAAAALPLHDQVHRYLPVLVSLEGFAIEHVSGVTRPSRHTERRSLRSYIVRIIDFVTILFLARSTGSPLRFFGLLGAGPMIAGAAILLWLFVDRLFLGAPLAGRPLLLLGLLLITGGLQAMAIGFLGELMVYLHYRDRHPDRVIPLSPAPPMDRAAPRERETRPMG